VRSASNRQARASQQALACCRASAECWAAQCAVVALCAGLGVGAANYMLESVGFWLCRALEARGIVRRFVSGGGQFEEHPLSNVWAVGGPYVALYYAVARWLWPGLSARMYVSFNVLEVWAFVWCARPPEPQPEAAAQHNVRISNYLVRAGTGPDRLWRARCAMVAHDAWFYGMHRLFHQARPRSSARRAAGRAVAPACAGDASPPKCFTLFPYPNSNPASTQVKPLFRLVHQRHHQNGSNVTALGTAFGDAADIGLCFVAFHFVLGVALWLLPAWNLAGVVTLIAFEVRGPTPGVG